MKVPQFMPFVDLKDYDALKESFEINWITEGPKSKKFNEEIRAKVNTYHGSFAPNGTLALYLALKACDIGEGDEVIVPNFTFIATANAVEMVGATPVFADINMHDFQLDVDACEGLVTEKTKAIIPAHLYGFACDMDAVMEFSERHDILVIEDAAQALGVEWKGKRCGGIGDIGCFSFFADKTITTGEGGFVATNNPAIHEKVKYLRNQGRQDRGTFIHPEIGYNFRMTDIQASLGLSQLKKFNTIVENKTRIHNLYTELLKDVTEVTVVQPRDEITSFIPFRVVLTVDSENTSEGVMNYMKEHEIEPRTFFYPLHKQPCFKKYVKDEKRYEGDAFRNSNYAYDRGVCLPSFASMTEEQVRYVCKTIKSYYAKKKVTANV